MSFNLKAVLNGQKIKLLEVQVVKVIHKNLIIIADNTAASLISVSEDFKEGSTLRIFKPKMLDSSVIESDPKIKPVKSFKNIQIKSVSSKRLGDLQTAANAFKASSPEIEGTLIEEIAHLPEKAVVPLMTLFVASMSKVINGDYGPYQTATIKDIRGDTSTLLISNKHVAKVPVQAVLQCTKLSKSKKADNNGAFKRVTTSADSQFKVVEPSVSANFLSNKLGEFSFKGTIFGCTDVKFFPNCPQ